MVTLLLSFAPVFSPFFFLATESSFLALFPGSPYRLSG